MNIYQNHTQVHQNDILNFRALSSTVELSTHNRMVPGAAPGGPTRETNKQKRTGEINMSTEQQENFTSFMHLHANCGRITAAINIDDTTHSDDGIKFANVSLAFCSPKDQFCRKTGRLIAEGRLKKGKFLYRIPIGDAKGIKDTIRKTIYNDLKDGIVPESPQWAK